MVHANGIMRLLPSPKESNSALPFIRFTLDQTRVVCNSIAGSATVCTAFGVLKRGLMLSAHAYLIERCKKTGTFVHIESVEQLEEDLCTFTSCIVLLYHIQHIQAHDCDS